jgi:mannose-6-phosphate isomerase-like protein (cupin superfamily)
MVNINRKTLIGLGLGAASSLLARPAEIADAAVGDEKRLAEGVTVKILGEGMSMVPGYNSVRLRDFIVQPGSEFKPAPMVNAMVCHILEGELQVNQDGRSFSAKKGYVWTCKTGTTEGVANTGSTVATMRIVDLLTG